MVNVHTVRATISVLADNENPDIANETEDSSKRYFYSFKTFWPVRRHDTENTLINDLETTY